MWVTDTLCGSPLAQPGPCKKDLEHSPEMGAFAVGRCWSKPISPGGATGEEDDLGDAAKTDKLCVLPAALKPRVNRPFYTFVSPSVIK